MCEAPPRIAPEARLHKRSAGGVLIVRAPDRLPELDLFRVENHQFRDSRVRGSRTPYMMSTNMFATMIRIESSTVIPITVE